MKLKDVVFAMTAIATGAACALGIVAVTDADRDEPSQPAPGIADVRVIETAPSPSPSTQARQGGVEARKARASARAERASARAERASKRAERARARISYRNCTEVRAAGKAPLRRGESGYARKLDRDGDGIACDK